MRFLVFLQRVMIIICCTDCQIKKADDSTNFMSYDECSSSSYCYLNGVLNVTQVNHVRMGHLLGEDGKCINVSIPKKLIKQIEKYGPMKMQIEGRVFPGSEWDETIKTLEVNGRRVGVSQCGDFYVFVE
ncbi:hypothetical protein [Kordiimonas sp. SCSIO 12610]|uniref:hypothetical protein n=1 Tax=Kordiimonas sp. SCSIO 12610 TaxID=2829597 RepID=UPI002109C5C1|nr:hypothetical protein [Kordiimonas sp. SCSIO 12610]UTW53822.1 hypothetical protein KFF44_08170 [Kordiimonas sp. SCSIO 12610]